MQLVVEEALVSLQVVGQGPCALLAVDCPQLLARWASSTWKLVYQSVKVKKVIQKDF